MVLPDLFLFSGGFPPAPLCPHRITRLHHSAMEHSPRHWLEFCFFHPNSQTLQFSPFPCSVIPTGGTHRLPTTTLSSRPERPDFFFRAVFWRVGPRSAACASRVLHRDGGIAAPSQSIPILLLLSSLRTLRPL